MKAMVPGGAQLVLLGNCSLYLVLQDDETIDEITEQEIECDTDEDDPTELLTLEDKESMTKIKDEPDSTLTTEQDSYKRTRSKVEVKQGAKRCNF